VRQEHKKEKKKKEKKKKKKKKKQKRKLSGSAVYSTLYVHKSHWSSGLF